MELKEIYEKEKVQLVEGEDKNTLTISGVFAKGDVVNKNGRLYPSELLKREVSRIQELIEAGDTHYGGAGSSDGEISIPGVSHIVKEIWINSETKEASLNAQVLETEMGKQIRLLISHGGSLYFSSKGSGTLTKVEGHERVNDDFKLLGIDITLAGSFPEARINKSNIVGESFTLDTQEAQKIFQESKMLKRFSYAKNAGYKKDFSTYRKEIEGTGDVTPSEMTQFKGAKESGFKGSLADFLSMIRN